MRQEWRTLETGSGSSTVVFAMKGTDHTIVTPIADEQTGIMSFCEEKDIPTDRLTFHIERSQNVLPKLDLTPLDLMLIDGGHAFPLPFLDFQYGSQWLGIGGLLLVDDTQLWTEKVLKDFLSEQPEWERLEEIGKTAVFRKIKEEPEFCEWTQQPYVYARSQDLVNPTLVDETKKRTKSLLQRVLGR